MPVSSLFKVSQTERNKFCTLVIDASSPSADYYFLVILSTIIVAMGLLGDNVILVIGGMLVTPLLSAILALALGIVINEGRVIMRSMKILGMSILFTFLVSFIAGLVSHVTIADSELVAIMKPALFTLLVGIVAGIAASYTWVKPGLNATLPGIAVTVALIPPLTAIGLTLAHGEWNMLRDVANVFLLNLAGIILASLLIFSLMEFYKARKQAIAEIKEEEKTIKKEKKEAEAAKAAK